MQLVRVEIWHPDKTERSVVGPSARVIASRKAHLLISPERAGERAGERAIDRVGSLAARSMFVVHECGAHVRRTQRRRGRRATENANGTRGYFLTTIHRMAREEERANALIGVWAHHIRSTYSYSRFSAGGILNVEILS